MARRDEAKDRHADLVAPWKFARKGNTEKEAFYDFRVDGTIGSRVGKIVMFTADNEEAQGKESLKLFHNALGGTVRELKGRGHYTSDDMGTEAFPEVVAEILD